MMLDKSKGIIKDRYTPILEIEGKILQKMLSRIKRTMKQLYTIDTALSQIRPQIRSEEYFDDDERMDQLSYVFSPVITIPEGYVNPWGHILNFPSTQILEDIVRDRNRHRMNVKHYINQKKISKEKIEGVEKIMKAL